MGFFLTQKIQKSTSIWPPLTEIAIQMFIMLWQNSGLIKKIVQQKMIHIKINRIYLLPKGVRKNNSKILRRSGYFDMSFGKIVLNCINSSKMCVWFWFISTIKFVLFLFLTKKEKKNMDQKMVNCERWWMR